VRDPRQTGQCAGGLALGALHRECRIAAGGTAAQEQLDYNLLYRWFVGLGVDEVVWVPTVITNNRDRLLEAKIPRRVHGS
jgi:hypothetical protein